MTTSFFQTPLRIGSIACALLAALALAGCSGLPDKPTRATMYDFGPGPLATSPTTRLAPLPPLALDDISTSGGALDHQAVLYRLGYADVQQLRPYAQARWSMRARRSRLRTRASSSRGLKGLLT